MKFINSIPMKKHIFYLILFITTNILLMNLNGQNPLMRHIYAADPSAHIWPDDPNTLWLYTSHDVAGTNHHATMFDYHVFSTTDLVHWTDHGRVLSVDDVDWAVGYAWATDAVYWEENYYLVYCMIEEKTGVFRTGLAISDVPQGPFNDIGYIQGIEWGQDPALFIDNGKPYLFWGLSNSCKAAMLTDDLLSVVPGTMVDLTDQLFEVFEGPWVHTYEGKYYLSYPGLPDGTWPEEMYYAIADEPLGPYTYMGKYIEEFEGHGSTNHGSIIKFKDDWIAFYHSAWGSGGNGHERSLMADFLHYNDDGTIRKIIPSREGISRGAPSTCIILLEAENGRAAGGGMAGTFVESKDKGFSGKGYVTGFDVRHDHVAVLAQVAHDMEARLKIRMKAKKDFAADILIGPAMMAGWDGLPIKRTKGWEEVDLGIVNLRAGDNRIRFSTHDAEVKVDYFKLEPVLEPSPGPAKKTAQE
jgi:hypothetical protein